MMDYKPIIDPLLSMYKHKMDKGLSIMVTSPWKLTPGLPAPLEANGFLC